MDQKWGRGKALVEAQPHLERSNLPRGDRAFGRCFSRGCLLSSKPLRHLNGGARISLSRLILPMLLMTSLRCEANLDAQD